MTFELNNASTQAYMVPSNTKVSIKLRNEDQLLDGWTYCGLDDEKLFMLISLNGRKKWVPLAAISYIEQLSSD